MNKSVFDNGNWSAVNGLPGQDDIINYLEHLFKESPNQCHTRRSLMDSVAREFGIPTIAQEAEGPLSHTPAYYTRLTYLITDAVQGKRRAEGNPFAKRLRLNVYQHISGDGVIAAELKPKKKLSKRLVDQARVSVRILKNLKHDQETIFCELHQWPDEIIEEAINMEFAQ